jgi:transcriptional regulator with GAF, ATPase, and Fis domain
VSVPETSETSLQARSAVRRERIALALERCDGNRTHAARELGLTYRGLLKKMQRYGVAGPAGGKSPARLA